MHSHRDRRHVAPDASRVTASSELLSPVAVDHVVGVACSGSPRRLYGASLETAVTADSGKYSCPVWTTVPPRWTLT